MWSVKVFFWIILGFSKRHNSFTGMLQYNNFFQTQKSRKDHYGTFKRRTNTRNTQQLRIPKNSTITTIVLFFEKDQKEKNIKNTQILIIARLSANIILRSFPFSFIGFISTVQCYKNRGFQPDKALNISLFVFFFHSYVPDECCCWAKTITRVSLRKISHSRNQICFLHTFMWCTTTRWNQ